MTVLRLLSLRRFKLAVLAVAAIAAPQARLAHPRRWHFLLLFCCDAESAAGRGGSFATPRLPSSLLAFCAVQKISTQHGPSFDAQHRLGWVVAHRCCAQRLYRILLLHERIRDFLQWRMDEYEYRPPSSSESEVSMFGNAERDGGYLGPIDRGDDAHGRACPTQKVDACELKGFPHRGPWFF